MIRQDCKLIGLTLLFVAMFHSSAQGSRSASPPEKIEPGQAVVLHVWPKGLSLAFQGKAGQNLPEMAAPSLLPPPQLPPPSLPERLSFDRAVTCAVWKTDVLFIFAGKAGEAITISVKSKTPGLDPHVVLFDSEKNKEASDDDGGGHGDSLIKNHVLKRSGLYTLSVGTAGGNQGKVEVLLKKAGQAK